MPTTNTIVVGFDGTEGAKTALAEALRLAKDIGGDVVAIFSYRRSLAGGESHDLDQEVQEIATAALAEAAAQAQAAGVPCTTEFAEGSPADALIATADDRNARYIVVGSYGETPLKGAIVGSTPYRLVHLSTRTVIVVRADED